jgi:proton-coupled amino acid transporter
MALRTWPISTPRTSLCWLGEPFLTYTRFGLEKVHSTAVFTFEGIGLIIPITESMREPEKFPRLLTYCMFGLMTLFAGAGILGYAAYGSDIQTVVIVNLPQDNKFVSAVQFLYSVAIMLSTPLQLFPAVRIMENGFFSRSGKNNSKVKWEKNAFRALITFGCTLVAAVGAADLDKFVSIVGSVACVPLCFCYRA